MRSQWFRHSALDDSWPGVGAAERDLADHVGGLHQFLQFIRKLRKLSQEFLATLDLAGVT